MAVTTLDRYYVRPPISQPIFDFSFTSSYNSLQQCCRVVYMGVFGFHTIFNTNPCFGKFFCIHNFLSVHTFMAEHNGLDTAFFKAFPCLSPPTCSPSVCFFLYREEVQVFIKTTEWKYKE